MRAKINSILLAYDPVYGVLGGGEIAFYNLARVFSFVKNKKIFIPFVIKTPAITDFINSLQKLGYKVDVKFIPQSKLMFAVYKFLQLKSSEYYKKAVKGQSFDLTISFSAFLAHLVHTPGSKHLVYFNTPARAWFNLPYNKGILRSNMPEWLINYLNFKLRSLDIQETIKLNNIIAISKNVAVRIYSFYNKKAKVIYPVFDKDLKYIKNLNPNKKLKEIVKNPFFVHVSRLEKYKNIDMLIDLYKTYNPDFVTFVVGEGSFEKYFIKKAQLLLRQTINKYELVFTGNYKITVRQIGNIIFTGYVPDIIRNTLYKHARASLVLNNEDLGFTKVESMLLGTPFIGCNYISNTELLYKALAQKVIINKCSTAKLYEKMLWLYKNPKLKIKKSHVSKLKQMFSFKNFSNNILEIINK